jgi:hypothetical protein
MELQNKTMFYPGMGFEQNRYNGKMKTLDWEKAREICETYPNSKIKAGIAEDWRYTHGVIFDKGEYKDNESCECDECGICVSSRWGTPVLVIDNGEPIECSKLTDEWEPSIPSKWTN